MSDSTAISGETISLLMLDQFSQWSKMRLEQAHPMKLGDKPCEFFVEVTALQILQMVNRKTTITSLRINNLFMTPINLSKIRFLCIKSQINN